MSSILRWFRMKAYNAKGVQIFHSPVTEKTIGAYFETLLNLNDSNIPVEYKAVRLTIEELKEDTPERPKVVCLCGSTRFSQAYQNANLTETMQGNIVLTIGCDMKSDEGLFSHYSPDELEDIKQRLDELHLRKIDLADEIFVLNIDGYVGESTKREIEYAKVHGKTIRYLSDETKADESTLLVGDLVMTPEGEVCPVIRIIHDNGTILYEVDSKKPGSPIVRFLGKFLHKVSDHE